MKKLAFLLVFILIATVAISCTAPAVDSETVSETKEVKEEPEAEVLPEPEPEPIPEVEPETQYANSIVGVSFENEGERAIVIEDDGTEPEITSFEGGFEAVYESTSTKKMRFEKEGYGSLTVSQEDDKAIVRFESSLAHDTSRDGNLLRVVMRNGLVGVSVKEDSAVKFVLEALTSDKPALAKFKWNGYYIVDLLGSINGIGDGGKGEIEADGNLVEKITYQELDAKKLGYEEEESLVRITITPSKGMTIDSFKTVSAESGAAITLTGNKTVVAVAPKPAEETPKEEPPAEQPPAEEPPAEEPPAEEPQAEEKPNTGFVVMLDPGHGGRYPGAIDPWNNSYSGYEKTWNWEVAGKVRLELEALGIKVLMVRTGDYALDTSSARSDNYARAYKANDSGADVYVSIHHNASSSSSPSGYEIIYYPDGDGSASLAKYMKGALESILGAHPSDRIYAPDGVNLLIGGILKDKLDPTDSYTVTRETKMPSVIVEVGYMTNKAERDKLVTNKYRTKAAIAIAQAIYNYLMK